MPTTDIERLVVSLEAKINSYERAMQKALGQTNSTASKIENRFKKMNKDLEKSFDLSGAASRGLATLGIGLSAAASIKAVTTAAKQFTDLQNSLKVTGLEGAALEQTFSSLFQIAQKNGTAIAPLTTLYSRAAQSQKELNASSADLLKFTDGVSTALRVAGTSSTQASGALLQLSQAIGSGVVRAEEFNSVNEGARPILQAVAAGLQEAGGSVSKLKTLVTEGKVSSEAFFRAFLAGMPQLQAQAASASATIGQANERIANAFILLVGQIDKITGASAGAAKRLNALAGVIEKLPGYFDAAARSIESFNQFLNRVDPNNVMGKIGKFMQLAASIPQGPAAVAGAIGKIGLSALSSGGEDTAPVDGTAILADAMRKASAAATKTPKSGKATSRFDAAFAAFSPDKVSLKDFPVSVKKEEASTTAFERSTAQLQKRIDLLKSESETLGQGEAARARARAVIELETAARKTNADAGLGQNVITAAQRVEIDRLATSYATATQKIESMNTPLMQLARSSADLSKQLNEMAADSLNSLTSELADVVTRTQTAQEAFSKMATAIINDLARIAIRQAITGPIAAGLSMLFGGGSAGAVLAGARAGGGPVTGGRPYLVGERGPEVVVPGRSGMVIPNEALRKSKSGGGISIVIQSNPTYQAGVTPTDMAQIQAMQAANNQQLRSVILSDIRRGVASDSRFLGQN